jgi:hypothetical protein
LAFLINIKGMHPANSQWQGHVPNIPQSPQRSHIYGMLFPSNASQIPSNPIVLSGSIPRTAQAAAWDSSTKCLWIGTPRAIWGQKTLYLLFS